MQLVLPDADTTLDDLPCGWLRLDPTGLVMSHNRPLAEFLHLDGQPIVGLPFDRLLDMPSRVIYQSYLQPLLKLGGAVSEISVTLPRGASQPPAECLLYAVASRSHPGTREVIVVPIRERRRIEAELQRVRRAADQAPGMIFQLLRSSAGEYRFAYASHAVRSLYECSEVQAQADAGRVFDTLEPDDRRRLLDALDAALRDNRPCKVRVGQRRRGDGQQRIHEWQAAPRTLAAGEAAWHGYVADVTEQRLMEEAAAQRSAEERELKRRTSFLARASHELRTPLNSILGFAQLLRLDGALDDRAEVERSIALIETAGSQMLDLVNQLLSLARLDASDGDAGWTSVLLARLVHDVLDAAGPEAAASGVTLGAEVPETAEVRGDPAQLRLLLEHLVANAIAFNRPGGTVRVSAAPAGDRWTIEVADTGRGLTEAQRERLFEPFAHEALPGDTAAGSGLGLVICQKIARRLGSELEVQSQPGVGTRVQLSLPSATGSVLLPSTANVPPVAPDAAEPACVLYVEDNETNILLMQAVLARREHVRLELARTAEEAVERVRAGCAPALLLCDLHLSDGDGIALLPQLRAQGLSADVPAVLVTATVADEVETVARAAGFQDIWTKPLQVKNVLARIDAWLARR